MTPSIGVATGACWDRPILPVLSAIEACGVRGVELSTPRGHFDPSQEHDVKALEEFFSSSALAPISIHAPFGPNLDLADGDAARRHHAVRSAVAAAEALRRVGGRIVVVHPSDLERQKHDAAARLRDAIESLTILAGECRSLGVTLAVESPLPHLIGGNVGEFGTLLGALDPSVGVCLDTGHAFLGRHWRQLVEVAGARLCHIHASDNCGVFDDHLSPGDGAIDWQDVGRALKDLAFTGWVMLELTCPAVSPGPYFARAAERTLALLADTR